MRIEAVVCRHDRDIDGELGLLFADSGERRSGDHPGDGRGQRAVHHVEDHLPHDGPHLLRRRALPRRLVSSASSVVSLFNISVIHAKWWHAHALSEAASLAAMLLLLYVLTGRSAICRKLRRPTAKLL